MMGVVTCVVAYRYFAGQNLYFIISYQIVNTYRPLAGHSRRVAVRPPCHQTTPPTPPHTPNGISCAPDSIPCAPIAYLL